MAESGHNCLPETGEIYLFNDQHFMNGFFSGCAPRTAAGSIDNEGSQWHMSRKHSRTTNIYPLIGFFNIHIYFFCFVIGDGEDRTPNDTKDNQMSVAALSPQDSQYQTATSGGLLQIVSIITS